MDKNSSGLSGISIHILRFLGVFRKVRGLNKLAKISRAIILFPGLWFLACMYCVDRIAKHPTEVLDSGIDNSKMWIEINKLPESFIAFIAVVIWGILGALRLVV